MMKTPQLTPQNFHLIECVAVAVQIQNRLIDYTSAYCLVHDGYVIGGYHVSRIFMVRCSSTVVIVSP